MSVTTENAPVQGQTTLQENRAGEGVYASLFEKINLAPASRLGDINDFLDDAALSEAPAAERLTAAMQVFMERIRQSGQRVEKLDKTLIDHHIAELDFQISRQLDAVMHHQEFQQVESLWRGLKQLVDNTDYRSDARLRLTVPVRLLPEPRLSTGRRIQLGRTGLLGLKAGKLSNSRESLTVSLGCYEGLQCSVLSPAEDGHYRFD
nr:type VI secretion system contractile sheath large subunit [Klebsiella variicola]